MDETMDFGDLDPFSDANYSVPSTPVFNSDILVEGRGADVLPVQSDTAQYPNSGSYTGLGNLLGSIGTTAKNAGTLVGTVQKDIKDAGTNFNSAKTAAASGNSISTFWLYATPTEKMMIVLAAAGLVLVLMEHK